MKRLGGVFQLLASFNGDCTRVTELDVIFSDYRAFILHFLSVFVLGLTLIDTFLINNRRLLLS